MKTRNLSFLGFSMGLVCSVYVTSAVAQQAWAFEQVSPAIYQLDQPVTQRYTSTDSLQPPTRHQHFTAVMVQVSPSVGADIESFACINDTSTCLPIVGGRLYTQAFNQYSAVSPILIVHKIKGWAGATPPVFIKSQLNLWWN
ncbi:hypothetical protein ACBP93_06290 [Paenalcaligenes hominis]|uniref:hypothetical protein n=1 Tax=Paenalcaligenes hominis TaxID=643674 RepID=UPI0035266E30